MGRELALREGLPACHQEGPRVGVRKQKKVCACVWVGGGGRKVGCPTGRRPDLPISAPWEGSVRPQSPG